MIEMICIVEASASHRYANVRHLSGARRLLLWSKPRNAPERMNVFDVLMLDEQGRSLSQARLLSRTDSIQNDAVQEWHRTATHERPVEAVDAA